MTVCIGVAVNECLVFAADSAATLVQTNADGAGSEILNVYQHGDKVFNLFKQMPVCAMTCGMGNIGQASISTLAKGFRQLIMGADAAWRVDPKNYSIGDIVQKARKFLYEAKYQSLNPQPPAPHSFEFWIGGYSSDFDLGHEVWKISIVNGDCPEPEQLVGEGGTGLFVGGQPGPVNRLVLGFDHALFDALREAGVDDAPAQELIQFIRKKLEVPMVSPTMPVVDAIELSNFLVETTKRYFRFLPGADIVGGETDIAVVTKYEGFKWIKRKHFYPAALNPLETGHV